MNKKTLLYYLYTHTINTVLLFCPASKCKENKTKQKKRKAELSRGRSLCLFCPSALLFLLLCANTHVKKSPIRCEFFFSPSPSPSHSPTRPHLPSLYRMNSVTPVDNEEKRVLSWSLGQLPALLFSVSLSLLLSFSAQRIFFTPFFFFPPFECSFPGGGGGGRVCTRYGAIDTGPKRF